MVFMALLVRRQAKHAHTPEEACVCIFDFIRPHPDVFSEGYFVDPYEDTFLWVLVFDYVRLMHTDAHTKMSLQAKKMFLIRSPMSYIWCVHTELWGYLCVCVCPFYKNIHVLSVMIACKQI